MRDRAVCGIGFVLADDAESLLAAIASHDRDRAAEPDMRVVLRRRHHAGGAAPGIPVADIAGRTGHRGTVIRFLRSRMSAARIGKMRFDLSHALRRYIIRMLGNNAVGQFVEARGILVYKGSA